MAINIAHALRALQATIAGLPEQIRPALTQLAAMIEAQNIEFHAHASDNQQQFDAVNTQNQTLASRVGVLESGQTALQTLGL